MLGMCSHRAVIHSTSLAAEFGVCSKDVWRIERSVIVIQCCFTPTAELRSCVKVEVAVLGSPSLMVCLVSVDVKRH